MGDYLERLLGIALAIFMAGSLLELGLRLELDQARAALRDTRFTGLTLIGAFLLCPAIAVALTKIVPLDQPYAAGLLLLGMAPCAPFYPAIAARARAELAYVVAFMTLTCAGTVVFMPLVVPALIDGFTASAWSIAKPLLTLIATPLALGIAIRVEMPSVAARLQGIVKIITIAATVLMVLLVILIYGPDFAGAVGTYAIATQLLFLALTTVAAYGLSGRLPQDRRSALVLGLCTRNIGAAIAPLYAAPAVDRRAIAMVVLAVPTTFVAARLAAWWLTRNVADATPRPRALPSGGIK